MTLKKIIAASIAAVFSFSLLTSCSQRGTMEMPFVEENKREYSSVVENSALTIYVDSNAENNGDGSEDSPFKSIPEAQAKIRELKAGEGLPMGGITVLVKDGQYKLDSALTFTEEDSGSEDCPITYVSENEFGAILTGGLILSSKDFEPLSSDEKAALVDETAKDKVVKVDLKKYGLKTDDWGLLYSRGAAWGSNYENGVGPAESEVFVNGERKVIARWPNNENVRTLKVVENGVAAEYFTSDEFDKAGNNRYAPEDRNIMNAQGGIFTVNDDIIGRASNWSTLENIWLFGYFKWSWSEASIPVKVFDLDAKTVELAQAQQYGISAGAPFYFFNVFSELDSVNEYYIDRENGILYIYKTDDFESTEIVLSCTLENLLNMSNASYVTLKGFGACATRNNGFSISGHDITVDSCKVYNVRGNGISANGNNITIQNCEVANVGSCGISISGGDSTNLIPSGNLVYNNYIHDFGVINRTYYGAISCGGCGNTIANNEMANAPHMAVGWSGPLHVFEYNEIYNVCTETSDCGAFYHGKNSNSYGCVIRYNYIYDVGNGSALAQGIYWDDGLAGQTAYGNIIMNVSGQGIMIGGGRDNVFENNIIINALKNPIQYDDRVRTEMADFSKWLHNYEKMTNNLIAEQANPIWVEKFPCIKDIIPNTEDYSGDPDDPMLMSNPGNSFVRNNVYYTIKESVGDNRIFAYENKVDYGVSICAEFEELYIIKDTLSDFPGWHNGDFTLKEDSLLKQLCPDFEPIPFDKIGRID